MNQYKAKYCVSICLMVFTLTIRCNETYAQVKIKDGSVVSLNTPNSAAVLELESNNKGLLLYGISLTNTTVWGLAGTPVSGMIVYNTNSSISSTNGSYPVIPGGIGLYYYNGAGWVALKYGADGINGDFWKLKGNTGTSVGLGLLGSVTNGNYLGTADGNNLVIGTGGVKRMIVDTKGNTYGGDSSIVIQSDFIKNSFVWGRNNRDSASNSLIAGQNNSIGTNGHHSSVFGENNQVNSYHCIVAGTNNVIDGPNSGECQVFGYYNTLSDGTGGTLLTGADNNIYHASLSLSSGRYNNDSAAYTFIGGQNNSIGTNGHHSLVFGENNRTNSYHDIVVGTNNIIEGPNSGECQVFGYYNTISDVTGGALLSGANNTGYRCSYSVIGGRYNIDSSGYSLITGKNNILGFNAHYGVVMGQNNKVWHPNSMAIGTSEITTANNQFVAGFDGGYNLYSSGNTIGVSLSPGGTSWTSISDRRSKEKIRKLDYGLEAVMNLRPSLYNYKGKKKRSIGFIAQEVNEVIPEIVEQTVMGPDHDFLGINYTELIPVLTKAIQEQQEEIELLKQQVKELQKNNR